MAHETAQLGEDAIKVRPRQVKLEKILLPHFALGVGRQSRPRPGPQPKSRIVKGGSPSICRNSDAMFWLTS
jgi:hypothetical protein